MNLLAVDEEDLASINSELRFLSLELMKIATERNVSFDEILKEYIKNTFKLQKTLAALEQDRVKLNREQDLKLNDFKLKE